MKENWAMLRLLEMPIYFGAAGYFDSSNNSKLREEALHFRFEKAFRNVSKIHNTPFVFSIVLFISIVLGFFGSFFLDEHKMNFNIRIK